ncbi:MAG: ABC transporter ATP-binding protein [Myxococcota bacterium]
METAVALKEFSLEISGKKILSEVSFTVEKGEYVAVIGPNGAGKTTLLKSILRITEEGSGSIEITGKPLESYSRRELAKRVAYVPQANGVPFPYTVYEFVMMGRYAYQNGFSGVSSGDKSAVESALKLTGTGGFAERRLDTLSGGERQKVYIAAAISQSAEILLLDEPATFLDPLHQFEIGETLKRLNSEKRVTIISATHDINSAVQSSDRIIALKEGRLVFNGGWREILKDGILEKIYGKRFLTLNDPRIAKPVLIPEGF